MKTSTLRGMACGMLIGSAACACYSMMSGHAQRKLKRMAHCTAHRMMSAVSGWF